MRAVQLKQTGGVEQLYIGGDVRKPTPKEHQVLIKVHATAINRADILQREGKYPVPVGESDILGLEASGTVEELGMGCTKWKVGDRVMALLAGGGNAEYVCAEEGLVMSIPLSMSFTDAAAIPEVWLTAFQILHLVGNVRSGDTVLIHAAGSGIGTAAVQLVKLTVDGGARSLVTAGRQDKIEFARHLGADEGFNYKDGSFVEKVLNATDGRGVDLVLDCVGASFWQQNVACLKTDGRWVVYGSLGGVNITGDLLGQILRKRLTLLGSTLRARSIEYKKKLVAEFSRVALPLFASGHLVPVIHSILPLDDIQSAHRLMESNNNVGKIVLEVVHGRDGSGNATEMANRSEL
jgi:tumor protein p53-inducible protein 3